MTARAPRPLLRSEDGAFDLPSIIVGVVVIGILTVGVLASVFGIIPFAQDNGAKQDLASVVTAEGAAKGTKGKFLGDSGLAGAGLLHSAPQLAVGSDAAGSCWVGMKTSGTGTIFSASSSDTNPRPYDGRAATGCLTNGQANALVGHQIIPAYTGQTVIGWASRDLPTVPADESDFAESDGMLSTYTDFAAGSAFPADFAQAAADRSSALLIAWEPWDSANPSVDQPAYRPANVTAGNFDAYLTDWLKQAESRAVDNTIMVRFAPEMNDAVRPWSIGTNGGNTAADYIAMWDHVRAIQQAVAPHVIMVWNPLVAGADPSKNPTTISSFFPGADKVDMLALDGFNWADTLQPGTCGWQSYKDVFGSPIAQIKSLASGKPWGIAEVASASRPDSYFQAGGPCYSAWGSWVYDWPVSAPYYSTPSDWITQAGWMKTMMQQAHADGALFVNMFNTAKETDWRLNSTPEGKLVPKTVAQDPQIVFGQQNSGAYIKAAQPH